MELETYGFNINMKKLTIQRNSSINIFANAETFQLMVQQDVIHHHWRTTLERRKWNIWSIK